MEILFDETRFGKSGTELVYAGLCISTGKSYFPEKNWTDFVVVVLGSWCESAARLHTSTTVVERMRFMEGPYHIEVRLCSDGLWAFECIERTARGEECFCKVMELSDDFLRSLMGAANQALLMCKTHNCLDADYSRLQRACNSLLRAGI